jgi:hypothetical protein
MAPGNVRLALSLSQLAFVLASSGQQANVGAVAGSVTDASAALVSEAQLTTRNVTTSARTSVATSKVDSHPLWAKSRQLTAQHEQVAHKMQDMGDLRYETVRGWACLSNGIMARAAAGGFQDNRWVLKLNNRVMEKFLEAYNADQAGQQARADWQEAFNEAKDIRNTYAQKGLTREQAITSVTLLMVYTHVFGDVRGSLAELGCRPKNDFVSIMELIDQCSRQFLGRNKDAVGNVLLADRVGSTSIRDWRMAVWSQVCEGDSGALHAPQQQSH